MTDLHVNEVEKYILKHVCAHIGASKLAPHHEAYALELYRGMDPQTFRGHKLSQIAPILGKLLGDKIAKMMATEMKKRKSMSNINNNVGDNNIDIDIKEYQVAAIGKAGQESNVFGATEQTVALPHTETKIAISEFLGINDVNEFKMYFNPESMYTHYYIVLDSDYRDTTDEISTNIRKFKWKYAPTQSVGVGFCNSVGVIRDIVGMRMYQPRVPYVATMNTDAKRVSVLIEEFSAQAFIAENGRRFHFLLRPSFPDVGVNSLELSTEDYNDGIFNFRKPITTFESITLSFGNPLDVISFTTPFDRFIIPFEFVCLRSDK